MSRINTTQSGPTVFEWVQKNQTELQAHPGWHFKISEIYAEELLRNQPPFTYLLRSGEHKDSYFISFVKKDSSLKHQLFVLESAQGKWRYRNGSGDSPRELVSEDLNELISMMIHCDFSACKPLIP